jgi:hypothetical protein
MISHYSMQSFFVGIIKWNGQLFLSHCLRYLTDTTKVEIILAVFIIIFNRLSQQPSYNLLGLK